MKNILLIFGLCCIFISIHAQQIGLTKKWDKRFGGTLDDGMWSCIPTSDGGCLMGGGSNSGIGGDKTQDNWDSTYNTSDCWVVKIDSLGTKEWDKRFGGNNDDLVEHSSLLQTKDGGYLLGGISQSDTGGDKTQANWAVGWYNYWVVKIDSAGNKMWDRVYGGTGEDDLEEITATTDGCFLLGGYSASDVSGDKTQPSVSGAYDYWVVKIDSAGNKLWDKVYGGDGGDQLYSLSLTQDHGFLLAGNSNSPASGDKTENNSFQNTYQTWLVKTDSAGNKQWDKTVFVNGGTTLGNAFQTSDGCYMIGSFTPAEIGYYKTQSNWDSSLDIWVIKFCDTTIINDVINLNATINFNAYPNPFYNQLDITLSQQNLHQATFTITNLLGQTIYTQNETNLSPTYTKMLDLSYLPNGVYWVSVVVDGERVTKEVIKSGP